MLRMSTAGSAARELVISWPGYGTLFFWQLGVLSQLRASHAAALSRATFVGSSAGALLSVLALCGVDPRAALELAHALCVKHGVFTRPLGLLGVWGSLVREWLSALLPADAHKRCSGGRLRVVLTTWPSLRRVVVSSFKDRGDLISVALASAHVPLVMDGCLTASCRGAACVDGSLLWILTRRCHLLSPPQLPGARSTLLLFDPFSDKQLRGFGLLRCVLACDKQGALRLLRLGAEYAARLDAASLAALQAAAAGAGGGDDRASEQAAMHEAALLAATRAV